MRQSFSADVKEGDGIRHNPRAAMNKAAAREALHTQVPTLNLQFNEIEKVKPPKAKSPRSPRGSQANASNPRFKQKMPQSARKYVSQATKPVVKNGPITPFEAKEIYGNMLTSYEFKEIDDFSEIFYVGDYSKKIKPRQHPMNNYGFDDSSHHLKVVAGDQIAYRFEVKSVFGKGAFGEVLCCYDHKVKKQVALKIIINTQQMHEQGRVEIAILQYLNDRDPEHKSHIVNNMDSFLFRGHVCATFEVLGRNLYEYSQSIRFAPFSSRQIRIVAKKLLTALSFCHSNGIVHCDLKPENVAFLPGSSVNCRLIDFGSSCFVGRQKFEYIQSRFYRAPEVILGIQYGPPMDMWSFACIITELLSGRPLFPADSEIELIDMMMEVFGVPPRNVISQSKRGHYFITPDGRPVFHPNMKKRRVPGAVSLRTISRINDKQLLDLLEKCLTWDQNERITASQALQHRWFDVKASNVPKSARTTRVCPVLSYR